MTRMHKIAALACATALSVGGTFALPVAPAAAIPVFDATNYTQNILQAARALEQINNQIKSLQNEATMLQNMARNLERIDFPQLQQISGSLKQIDQLMGEAKGISFKVDELEQSFGKMFPGSVDRVLKTDARAAEAKVRLDTALEGFRHSMTVQAEVVSQIRDDAALLSELSKRSDGAVGSLQAQQATNQLLVLSTKQQLQLQEMMAAEFRSDAIERARRVQAEAEAKAATRRFLGSGKAYTPGN
ncbi:MAG TPA: P-type conjugative transfer protein TrbJ [Sphingomicrobium sp.]